MRRRYVQLNGELVEVVDGELAPVTPMIQPDIAPYKSMVTGEMIEGRAAHREHLRRHGVFEVGNEVKYAKRAPIDSSPEKRKELIRAQIDAMPHKQFKQALRRDIDFSKWNSRR